MEILCRICGGDQNLKFFQNDKQLVELLELCASIVIKENDMLPKFICKQCEDGLLFSYRLRKQSEETEKRLRHEIESQTISTTTDIEDELSAYNIQQHVPTVPQNRDQRLISDADSNICTSTNQSEKTLQLADAEQSHKLITASKDVQVGPAPNETSKENVTEILDLENMPELSHEERLQVELRKRGVFMCKRVLPEISGSSAEPQKDHEVIAEKRIQLDTLSQVMPVDDIEKLPQNVCSETLENDASNQDDIIELLDDDEPVQDLLQQEESQFEEMQTFANEDTEIIEEIISSAEEEESQYSSLKEQTDIVYEESDSDCNELIDINECQMYFTKVEHNTFDDVDETRETRCTTIQDNSVVEYTTVISSKTITEETVANYTCEICNISFTNKYLYRDHVKMHDVKSFACTMCDKKFLRRDSLTRHIHAHNNKEELHCPLCERTFQSRFNLSRHARAAHKNMGFMCDTCGQIFMRSDVLQQHMVKHNTQGDVQCELCPKRFFAVSSMRRHMLSHTKQSGEENLSNDTTESEAGTSKSGDKKEKTKKNIYCVYCGKVSKGHFTHKMHLRTHTQEKPHKCVTCSKAFRTLAALTTHERIHDDVRPYQCEYCLLSFRQQGHLREHRMIHEGITPHVCSICQLSFTKKGNMLVHMRIHSGEYPYKCLTCGAQFNRLPQLRKHQYKVHKKEVDDDIIEVPVDINDAEELNPEDDTECNKLANELSGSDSDSIEIIETENDPAASSIQSNAIGGDDNDDEDCYEVTYNANKDVAVESSVTENISDDFVAINKGVVLVVDDNAKFNSLFIMDD